MGKPENTERLEPVLDRDHLIGSTGDMRIWYTGKPSERTRKSHSNVCVYDSTWEASGAFALDDSAAVEARAKNDHRIRSAPRLSRSGEEVPTGLSGSTRQRRHAGPGNKRTR